MRGGGGPAAWASTLQDQRAALEDFLALAAAVPPDRWREPRAPGKWSPAQEVTHVTLAYEVIGEGLVGGAGMQIVTRPPKRLLLRWLVLPYILRTGRFPGRPTAPREVAPPGPGVDASASPAESLARLERAAASFERAWMEARSETPSRRVGHAYFGAITLDQMLRLGTVHTRHHAKNLVRTAS